MTLQEDVAEAFFSRGITWFARAWNTPWKTAWSLKTPWKWFCPWKLLEFVGAVLEFYENVLEYLRLQQNKFIFTLKRLYHNLTSAEKRFWSVKKGKAFISGQFSVSYSKYLSNRAFNRVLWSPPSQQTKPKGKWSLMCRQLRSVKFIKLWRSSFYYQMNSKGQRGNCYYNQHWEHNSLYKGWVTAFKGDRKKALCKCCDRKTPWIKVLLTCMNHE